MRLLVLTETHPPDRGGMSESCDRILRGLAREGIGLDVVHFDRRALRFEHRVTSSGSFLRVPPDADVAHTMNLLWNELERTVDARAITHVVAFGGTLPLLGAPVFAAWMARPLVTMIRGNELDTGLFDPRRRAILDDALRRSAAVCTLTTVHAEKIAALHEAVVPHVIANGIDLDLWQATGADRTRADAIRATAEGRRILGLFGHLKNKKGVPFFIDVLVRSGLADRFHLLLAGEIDTSIEGVAYTLLPVMDRYELIPLYLASDLVVLPSHYDGFPNVLIEAMALARPLIASSAGGMRDVLTDAQGFLFPPGDAHACRDAIARAAHSSDEELRRMGLAAEVVARRRCDARDETRRYLDVLQQVQEVFDDEQRNSRRAAPSAARQLSRRAR
ncbi:MAG TPA: glycosyltransferase family 4 protein [Thermoanaerobaculia bacterium]|jgi:glycosyltransferase involved in cell wall biosynthesis|nr:glycosyltransferase family 4 protein [Thermoanaerobaculia bacterium]